MDGWDRRGGVFIAAPHVVSVDADNLAVFALSTDHQVSVLWRRGTDWTDWSPLPGEQIPAISAPSAISRANGRVDLFCVSPDHSPYHRWWDGSDWHAWQRMAGQAGGAVLAAPLPVAAEPDALDLLVLGTNLGIYHQRLVDERWSGWHSIGDLMISPPEVASAPSSPDVDVFSIGADSRLYHTTRTARDTRDAHGWAGWQSLGENTAISLPSVVARPTGQLDLFFLGEERALYHQCHDQTWSEPVSLGGTATSPPRAFAWHDNRVDVFVVGEDSALWLRSYRDGAWQPWQSLGGQAFSPVTAVATGDRLELFVLGADSAVWHRTMLA